MNLAETPVLAFALETVFVLLAVSTILSFIRLVRGPSLPDRVVALDLIALHAVALIATDTIATNDPSLLRPAIVLALISFLGTIAFARFLEKRIRE